MNATCPWCSAPRDGDAACTTCPRCGADYAKAEAIKRNGRAALAASASVGAVAQPVAGTVIFQVDDTLTGPVVSDPELEFKFCVAAIPAALLCALLFHASGLGASLQRIFLTMPVHELGHAVSAWFCGYTAVPTFWKTLIPESRGLIAPLGLAGAIGYGMFRAWRGGRRGWLAVGAVLLLMQIIGTFAIKPDTAQMLFTFGGDGMGMILATLLMASFFFGKNTQLYKGSLRWGFVVIGAAAYIDIFATWWKSRKDQGAIPYGTMDGMASDSMKLVEQHAWTLELLVNRYYTLGLLCLLALIAVYAWGVWCAKQECDAWREQQRRDQLQARANQRWGAA